MVCHWYNLLHKFNVNERSNYFRYLWICICCWMFVLLWANIISLTFWKLSWADTTLLPEYKLHGIKAFILILFLKLLNSTINRCVFIDTHTHTHTYIHKLVAIAMLSLSPPVYASDWHICIEQEDTWSCWDWLVLVLMDGECSPLLHVTCAYFHLWHPTEFSLDNFCWYFLLLYFHFLKEDHLLTWFSPTLFLCALLWLNKIAMQNVR